MKKLFVVIQGQAVTSGSWGLDADPLQAHLELLRQEPSSDSKSSSSNMVPLPLRACIRVLPGGRAGRVLAEERCPRRNLLPHPNPGGKAA
jgi:hypothetical protein